MPDVLAGPRIKIERAKRHIRDLEAEIAAFHGRGPYEIVAYDDAKTGDKIFRVKIREPVPTCLSGAIGDVVHNLRAALDQLAWQLVIANRKQPRRRTGFPVADSVEEFESDAAGKIKGVSARAYRFIRRLKPYKGGREFFWTIHELDRLDKHQSIIPVGAAYTHVTIKLLMAVPWDDAPLASPPISLRPKDRCYPLKDGTTLYVIKAAARQPPIDENPQFTFDVAFGEGQIVDGEPVVPALQQLTELVERVIAITERRVLAQHARRP
jgi:hypothetical protein